ncbi:hypothetical protein RvY_12175 [Ramazzottius varieornatus]|uniref:Uncharacterized protein n=1 Tax=Ramazzottius varieornatus TaxID=947166 RepID=A0A1D1VKY2_RAMVA|nr:hypothetical protein RvY_12175 [Ramazzottius varieornatus]
MTNDARHIRLATYGPGTQAIDIHLHHVTLPPLNMPYVFSHLLQKLNFDRYLQECSHRENNPTSV